jgi:DNA-binding LytR/AlgR family response regulator
MNKINVLIIEDRPEESEPLVEVLKTLHYSIVGVARTYKEAIEFFFNSKVDLVVVDIFLNGKPEGITFAETISAIPNSIKPIIFLTSSKDRQIFEHARLVKPFSFLMKPFNELEVLYAIELAIEKFYNQPNVFSKEESSAIFGDQYLFIKKNEALKKVFFNEILYVQVDDRYCNIVTENDKFMILISLSKMTQILDSSIFIKSNRNCIINKDQIETLFLKDNLIILKGNHKITLSDNYKEFISKMNILK